MFSHRHNHLSATQITLCFKRSTCSISPEKQLLLDLAPNEVYRLHLLPDARWSLTPPFHPCVRQSRPRYIFCCTVCQLRALHKSFRKYAASVCCPVIIRHFFRRSPDFRLTVPPFHEDGTARLYPICQLQHFRIQNPLLPRNLLNHRLLLPLLLQIRRLLHSLHLRRLHLPLCRLLLRNRNFRRRQDRQDCLHPRV